MKRLKNIYSLCKKSNSSFLIVTLKHLYYLYIGKNIISHQNAVIKGVGNITTKGSLKVGVDYVGFTHHRDGTYLNVNGRIEILGHCSIGRGCRFDIGKNGMVTLGDGTYINPFTNIIIMHKLEIGKNCSISWNCQFLDEDFHQINYEKKKKQTVNDICIGNKVWIGSNVSIYKGTVIPDGCVIASNSVVKGCFNEENVLIAGNPAKVIKRNITWQN